MEGISAIFDNAKRVAMRTGINILDHAPALFGAAVLLLGGWLAARLLRAATQRAGSHINRLLDRVFRSGRLANYRLSPKILSALAEVIFWLTLLVFASIAARAAGLTTFATWLDRGVSHLPNLLAGALVIIVGFFVGAVVRDLTIAAAPTGRSTQSILLGNAAQIAVIVVAFVIGLDQFGINVSLIVTILAIVAATVLGGFGLAFGLGARDFVGNLIGSRELQREIEPGQIIRCGEIEGEVLQITPTALVLATKEGRVRIPSGTFNTKTLVIVDTDISNE